MLMLIIFVSIGGEGYTETQNISRSIFKVNSNSTSNEYYPGRPTNATHSHNNASSGADGDDARPRLPNIEAFARGYNILRGNPRPSAHATGANVDSGWRGYIFEQRYDTGSHGQLGSVVFDWPDRVDAAYVGVCGFTFASSGLITALDYKKNLQRTMGFNASLFNNSFKASDDYKNVQERQNEKRTQIVESTGSCSYYEAFLRDKENPMQLSENFRVRIQHKLPPQYDEKVYMSIIEDFGTHYATTVRMGGTFGQRYEVNAYNYRTMSRNGNSGGLGIGIAATTKKAITGGFNYLTEEEIEQSKTFESILESRTAFYIGGRPVADSDNGNLNHRLWQADVEERPLPTSADLQPLFKLLTPQSFPGDQFILNKRQNLETALRRYCTSLQRMNPPQIECYDQAPMETRYVNLGDVPDPGPTNNVYEWSMKECYERAKEKNEVLTEIRFYCRGLYGKHCYPNFGMQFVYGSVVCDAINAEPNPLDPRFYKVFKIPRGDRLSRISLKNTPQNTPEGFNVETIQFETLNGVTSEIFGFGIPPLTHFYIDTDTQDFAFLKGLSRQGHNYNWQISVYVEEIVAVPMYTVPPTPTPTTQPPTPPPSPPPADDPDLACGCSSEHLTSLTLKYVNGASRTVKITSDPLGIMYGPITVHTQEVIDLSAHIGSLGSSLEFEIDGQILDTVLVTCTEEPRLALGGRVVSGMFEIEQGRVNRMPLCDVSPSPTRAPTPKPTSSPTATPTPRPTSVPTPLPSPLPTSRPTSAPTAIPTPIPTSVPTSVPTSMPTAVPTSTPTPVPTSTPTAVPTPMPTAVPTPTTTAVPTPTPSAVPTPAPTARPTSMPTSNDKLVGPSGMDDKTRMLVITLSSIGGVLIIVIIAAIALVCRRRNAKSSADMNRSPLLAEGDGDVSQQC